MKTLQHILLRARRHFCSSAIGVALCIAPTGAQTLSEIKVPDALSTSVTNINEQGVVTGSYFASDRSIRGFISDHGAVTTFSGPADAIPIVTGINISKSVIGWYNDIDLEQHAFLREFSGRMSEIAPANADATYPVAVDDLNNVAGYFRDNDGRTHGFVLKNSQYTVVDYPGATMTRILDQNSRGIAVGLYQDNTGVCHGFSWLAGTGFARWDYPGATSTQLIRIDVDGRMIGVYASPSKTTAGFLVGFNGRIKPLVPPSYSSSYTVSFYGIGSVLGGLGTVDTNSSLFINSSSSYVWGHSGQFEALSNFSYVKFLDANRAGMAVGYYTDALSNVHSFRVDLSSYQ